ncbi:glycosyltransferase family 2 protein [Halobacteriovorax marinus]|nr:glycosyltransferase family 2 protein [Halobacteriovorax marinus]
MNRAHYDVSVVVPCYKDEGNILELYARLSSTLKDKQLTYEVIYINDGSPDNSKEVLNSLADKHPELTVIHHSRNFGLMSVYDTGAKQSLGDCVIFMDGDLQDPPEVIPKFIDKWREGYDVVYGQAISRDEKLLRKIGYWLFYRLWDKLSNFEIPHDSGDFSLIDRKVVDVINQLQEKERFFRGLRAWVGFKQTCVPFHRDKRFSGTTTQSLYNYLSWAIFAITSFSHKPLRFLSLIAVVTAGINILWFLSLLLMYIFNIKGPEGYLMLISLNLILGSLLLICLGTISEYITRIYSEIKRRPTSIISETINCHRLNFSENNKP